MASSSTASILKQPDRSLREDQIQNKSVKQPCPESNEGMVLAPNCQCQHCHHWTNSATWCPTPDLEFFAPTNYTENVNKRPEPLLKDPRFVESKATISRMSIKHYSKIQKLTVSNILVHSESPVYPTEFLNAVNFTEEVQKVLQQLDYKYSTAVQSFAWPAIFKGMNVFLIGRKESGKTMSYIPAICTFASKTYQCGTLAKHKGPLAVIICSNSSTCETIFNLVQKILGQMRNHQIKAAIITYPTTFRNNFDILITMPGSLIQCVKSKMFTLKRLRCFVIEEANIVFNRNQEQIYNILEATDQMLSHRINTQAVQLFVVSEKWTHDLKTLLKRVYDIPLVCISNHLEAAIYGGSQIILKFLLTENKNDYLSKLLKPKFHIIKTIVVCDTSEITAVNKYLAREGIEVLALNNDATKDEIDEKEFLWTTATGGEYKVLICTDFILESLLSVNDANWLINYSLPESWKQFINRFRASLAHYNSPLDGDNQQSDCKSFLMIDNNCDDKMIKIINLIGRFGRDLPETMKMYMKELKSKTEEVKISNQISLCDDLKLFGKCSKEFCINRHFVCEDLDVTGDLPKNGKIFFKILNIKNVTNFTIQIIKHIDTNGEISTINIDDHLKSLKLAQDFSLHMPEKIKIGTSYIHCDNTPEGKDFMLCHAISNSAQKVGGYDNNLVEVKLMGGQILQTLQTNLYEIPSHFGVVEIYIANLVPPQPENNFSGRSFLVTKKSLSDTKYKNMIFFGNVLLQMNKTLWLDNALQEVTIDKNNSVVSFNLKTHLLNLNTVKIDMSVIDLLYSLCERFNISLPKLQESKIKKQLLVKEPLTQCAFLDDEINEVVLSCGVSPDEFYVRLTKFQKLLNDLETEMTAMAKVNISYRTAVAIGQYYLALDPAGFTYARVQILYVKNARALCFYVDYGDEAFINVSELKVLPTKFLKKLPFQAICCRLHGVFPRTGEWSEEALSILYDYMFEPKNDIFRSLFVKVCSSEQLDCYGLKTKYAVLLKDGFGKNNPLINQILIDSGIASSIFPQIDDFNIPCYELQGNVESSEQLLEKQPLESDFEAFDLEVFDADTFLTELGLPTKKMLSVAAGTIKNSEKTESENTEKSSDCVIAEIDRNVAESSSSLTPDIFWTQDERFIKIKINLIGVEHYKCNVIRKRFFEFGTMLGDKKYELKFSLHKFANLVKHKAYGQDIRLILEKVEPLEWMQLSATSKKLRNVHYQIPKEREKAKKRFLQLDITDDESNEEDKNLIYFDVSDMDSDFDAEFDDDSSE